jgi:hypothetical protein
MAEKNSKDEIERRLEQSRRLKRSSADPTTFERLSKLIDDLETEQKRDTDENK